MKKVFNSNGSYSHIIYDSNTQQEKRIDFFESSYSLQCASIKFKKGDYVNPHLHLKGEDSKFIHTHPHEIWVGLSGEAKINLYEGDQFKEQIIFSSGQILITFPGGGHSLEVESENFIMFEIKNTPYFPEASRKINI